MTLTLPFFDSSAFNFSDAYKTPNFIASCSGGLIDRCQDATERDGKTRWEEREQKRGEREGLIVDAIGNFLTISLSLSVLHSLYLWKFLYVALFLGSEGLRYKFLYNK